MRERETTSAAFSRRTAAVRRPHSRRDARAIDHCIGLSEKQTAPVMSRVGAQAVAMACPARLVHCRCWTRASTARVARHRGDCPGDRNSATDARSRPRSRSRSPDRSIDSRRCARSSRNNRSPSRSKRFSASEIPIAIVRLPGPRQSSWSAERDRRPDPSLHGASPAPAHHVNPVKRIERTNEHRRR